MDTETRAQTQRAEDLWRLCRQAEEKGIEILLTADGEMFATSHTNGALLHRVTERGCDCRGFTYWQRCSHHSLLLAQLGMLPDVRPALATCSVCEGSGFDPECSGHRVAGGTVSCPCYGCAGHGTVVPVPALAA